MSNYPSLNPNPNPPPPGAPPPPSATVSPPSDDYPNRSATAKRPREEYSAAADEPESSADAAPPLKKRVKVAQDVVYRIIVPSRQIGKVIGKVGHRIQKIREDTKATVKIADAIARHEERVIIISSKDNDDMFCDAENALHQIVTLILKDDDGTIDGQKVGAGHVAANTIRFLIAGSQAGGLIGVSGQNIETLRNSSGAAITVLAQHQMPLCASAHESDRVVQVSGDVPAVLRAVVEIGCQLRDNPPKQVISISPTYKAGKSRPSQPYVDPSSAEYVNLTMLIPESLAGGLIGRCGSNISRIRAESGATIKVHGGKGENEQRQIDLGGNAQQVTVAKQRVDEYVYSQLMLQAGGSQLQETMQLRETIKLQQTMQLQLQQSMQLQQPIPDTSATMLQGYGHSHGHYMNSNQEAQMMASYQQYSSSAPQAPAYYGQSYPAPQM